MKRKKISIEEAKKINIEYPLKKLGILPVKRYSNYGMYFAFDREESTPSLKVDYGKGLYYDFGSSKGGDIISLVQLIRNCSVSEALSFLSDDIISFSFQQQPKKLNIEVPSVNYEILKVQNLVHPALIKYIESRSIPKEIARIYCVEIHYKQADKIYFSLAFKNDKEGFELRNKYYKGCINNKSITSLKSGNSQVCIFEGFMDFLSYKTLYNKNLKEDYIICNSTALVKNLASKLRNYKTIYLCFDNDNVGNKSTEFLKKELKGAIDCRMAYFDFKDLNEYLMNNKTFNLS